MSDDSDDLQDTPPSDPLPPENEVSERLWAARGVEDVFFQREAQVTWWTVLGGIAVAALLTQLENLLTSFDEGGWYYTLYFLSSCFIIINSWVQTSWGSLVLRWPISIPTSIVLFFQGISMSVAALYITRPAIWYAAIFVVVLTAVINQVIFMKIRAWTVLPADMISRARIGIRVYILFAIMTLSASLHLGLLPGTGIKILWGIIAIFASVFSLYWQHVGMTEEKRLMGIA